MGHFGDTGMRTKSIVQMAGALMIGGVVMTTQTGCLVAAVGAAAGTVAYVKGDLEATVDAKPDVVIEATRTAAKDLGFAVEYANGSSIDGQAKLRSGADKEIFIKTKAIGDKSSKISIRVGTFGDESTSHLVLDKIKANLPAATAPTAAAPTAAAQ